MGHHPVIGVAIYHRPAGCVIVDFHRINWPPVSGVTVDGVAGVAVPAVHVRQPATAVDVYPIPAVSGGGADRHIGDGISVPPGIIGVIDHFRQPAGFPGAYPINHVVVIPGRGNSLAWLVLSSSGGALCIAVPHIEINPCSDAVHQPDAGILPGCHGLINNGPCVHIAVVGAVTGDPVQVGIDAVVIDVIAIPVDIAVDTHVIPLGGHGGQEGIGQLPDVVASGCGYGAVLQVIVYRQV